LRTLPAAFSHLSAPSGRKQHFDLPFRLGPPPQLPVPCKIEPPRRAKLVGAVGEAYRSVHNSCLPHDRRQQAVQRKTDPPPATMALALRQVLEPEVRPVDVPVPREQV